MMNDGGNMLEGDVSKMTGTDEALLVIKKTDAQRLLDFLGKMPCADVYEYVTILLHLPRLESSHEDAR